MEEWSPAYGEKCKDIPVLLCLAHPFKRIISVFCVTKKKQFIVSDMQVDEYIHRILVEEDAQELSELYRASAEAGEKLYKKGAFAESQIDNLDVYVLKKARLKNPLLKDQRRYVHHHKQHLVFCIV